MSSIHKLSIGLLATIVTGGLLAGCNAVGIGGQDDVTGTLSLSLGNVAKSAEAQTIVCYWVVGRVDVFANGEEVGTEPLEIRNDDPLTTVTVDVTVPEGETLFRAEAYTIEDRLVFEGEADDFVDVGVDPPTATIDLFGIGSALEFCFDYESGQAEVFNRGASDMTWIAESLDLCNNEDCVFPFPDRGQLAGGESQAIFFEHQVAPEEYACLGMTDGFHRLRIPICFGNPDLGIGCEPPEDDSC